MSKVNLCTIACSLCLAQWHRGSFEVPVSSAFLQPEIEITRQLEPIDSLQKHIEKPIYNLSLKPSVLGIVSVRDFGAMGDGTTDDTASIQAALDSGHKIVRLPKGSYVISSALRLRDQQTLTGDGIEATILSGRGTLIKPALIVNETVSSANAWVYGGAKAISIHISGLSIWRGDSSAISGIELNAVTQSTVTGVALYGFNNGIYLRNSGAYSGMVTISKCEINSNDTGVVLENSYDSLLFDNNIGKCRIGVSMRSGANNNIIHSNKIFSNHVGIFSDNSRKNHIVSNQIDASRDVSIEFVRSSLNIVSGNQLKDVGVSSPTGKGKSHLSLVGSNKNTVSGNSLFKEFCPFEYEYAFKWDRWSSDNQMVGNTVGGCYSEPHFSGALTAGNVVQDNLMRIAFSDEQPTTGRSDNGKVVTGSIIYRRVPAEGDSLGWIKGHDNYWREFGQFGYRVNSGSPIGTVSPKSVGEEVFDNDNRRWFKSTGPLASNWVQISRESMPLPSISVPLSFSEVPPRSSAEEDILYPGVIANDAVVLTAPPSLEQGLVPLILIPRDGVVRLRIMNVTETSITSSSAIWRFAVIR